MKLLTILFALFIGLLIPPKADTAPLRVPDIVYIRNLLPTLTLEEKIGQILCPTIPWGTSPSSRRFDSLLTLVNEYHIGAFHIIGGPASSTIDVINELQSQADIPLVFTADLEGGLNPVVSDGTLFPRAMALASTGNTRLINKVATTTALEGRAIGIGINYYPVMDVNTEPNNPIINYRSFGDDPELVHNLSQSYFQGNMQGGMMPTAKHFPGHGSTHIDTHSASAVLDMSEQKLREIHLEPFKLAVWSGIPAVMTGHLIAPTLGEPNLPATLSPELVTGVLEKEFGFDGLTISDAMLMNAITDHFSNKEAAVLALKAGIDLLIFPPNVPQYFTAIKEAVESGEIPMSRLDNAVEDVLRAKTRLDMHNNQFVEKEVALTQLKTSEAIQLSNQAAGEAIILHRNEQNILPTDLSTKDIFVLQIGDLGPRPYALIGQPMVDETIKRAQSTTVERVGSIPDEEQKMEVLKKAEQADLIICNAFLIVSANNDSIDLRPEHIALINQLRPHSNKLIWAGFGSPYALQHFPWIQTAVIGCDTLWEMQRATVRRINGETPFVGKLPVTIPARESVFEPFEKYD